jgi:hypothetical protein
MHGYFLNYFIRSKDDIIQSGYYFYLEDSFKKPNVQKLIKI